MTVVPAATTPLFKTFELAYDITSAPAPAGLWDVSLTASECFEASVLHTNNVSMIVGSPGITISKNSIVLSDPINASSQKQYPALLLNILLLLKTQGLVMWTQAILY